MMPLSELFFGNKGAVFVKKKVDNKFYHPAVLNLSWLPQHLINRICKHILREDSFSFFLEKFRNKQQLPVKMHLGKSRIKQLLKI